jgi:glycosyltransferase involved in cell wall biosynthesis
MPGNVRLLSGLTDAQLRWVYAHTRILVAPSFEDYGLSPLEAAVFGRPSLTLRAGGYFDTVREGVTGLYVDAPEPALFRAGLAAAEAHPWDPAVLTAHAEQFSEATVDLVGLHGPFIGCFTWSDIQHFGRTQELV